MGTIYYANASKTCIVIKKEFQSEAYSIFGDTQVNITSEGYPHLGVPLDSPNYVSQYVSEKVQQWSKEHCYLQLPLLNDMLHFLPIHIV